LSGAEQNFLMLTAPTLIEELEATMSHGSGAQRAQILQRVTQLFLQNADSYEEDHVALFDDVISRLIERIEQQALVRLSSQLAPINNAPANVIQQLARNDSIEVSRPVLAQSPVLTDDFLVELAQTKSQQHLAAIAERSHVAEKVTDVLIERGNAAVTMTVTGNVGARFSRKALLQAANRANADAGLAENIINRPDIPHDVFEHLLSKATEVVRQRLMRSASPEMRTKINQTLSAIAQQTVKPAPQHGQGERRSAATLTHQDVPRLKSALSEYARAGQRQQTIDTLSALSKLPVAAIKSLLHAEAEDGVLILCKAVGLGWPDAKQVLAVMTGASGGPNAESKNTFDKYYDLTEETALRVIRFVKSCKAVSKADLERML
jgi:Uncharacterised protein conserved in bacteria (DUF2336)